MRTLPIAALLVLSIFNVGAAFAAPCAGFTDVDDANLFCADVEWMKNRGITHGLTATTFAPSGNVTRIQMAAFMHRLGGLLDIVCRGTDPACYNEWITNRQNRVLIYSRTTGPRHASIGPALAAGVNPPLGVNNVAQKAIVRLLNAEGIVVDWTEEVTRIPGHTATYRAVIFLNTSRDALWAHGRAVNPSSAVDTTTFASLDQARVNLRQFMKGGGGFVGIHGAFGTEYNWPYYEGLLGGTNYFNHAANQNGIVRITASDSATGGIGMPGTTFAFRDEWFNLHPLPTHVKVLATVDDTSLATHASNHPGHAGFHPVAWCHYYDGGRAFLTTLGHDSRAFDDLSLVPPGSLSYFAGTKEFQSLLVNGIKSAMGLLPFCT